MVERLLLLADGPVDAAAVMLALSHTSAPADWVAAQPGSGPLAARLEGFERAQILAELTRNSHYRLNNELPQPGSRHPGVGPARRLW